MWRQQLLIGLGVAIVTLCIGVKSADACSCHGAGPACEQFWRTPIVFSGRVISVTPIKVGPGETIFKNQFRVTEAFRGTTTGAILEVMTANTNCDHFFGAGQNWLVYAGPRHDGPGLATSICTRTQRLESSGADVEYARRAYAPGRDRGRILGQITYGGNDRIHPVAGARIILSAAASKPLIATTDGDGRYEVLAPAGKYRIAATLPPGMSLAAREEFVELLDERACAVADLFAEYLGAISGRVLSAAGSPVANIAVELLGRNGQREWYSRGFTDTRGRYEISGLKPGEYRPAVPIGWNAVTQGVRGTFAFQAGATSERAAPVVKVDGGSRRTIEDIVLPKTTRVVQIHGTVVRSDGRPVAGISVGAKADFDDWSALWTTIKTDRAGRFVLAMIAGERYRVVADPAGQKPSNPRVIVFVDPAKPTAPLRLVLKE